MEINNIKILFVTDDVLEVPFNTLVGANFNGLNLNRVILEGRDLHEATFINTDLRGAILANSNFNNCSFLGASLITAFSVDSTFKGANLYGCRAFGCNFTGADLTEANFSEADLLNADLSKSNLCGAVMSCKNIETVTFTDAVYDSATKWPKSFNPERAGCRKVD